MCLNGVCVCVCVCLCVCVRTYAIFGALFFDQKLVFLCLLVRRLGHKVVEQHCNTHLCIRVNVRVCEKVAGYIHDNPYENKHPHPHL